jgi:hypothetical protein
MKKSLFFTAFMLAVFSVSANAAPCVADGQKVFCQYESGCWQINSTGTGGQSTCETQAGYCTAKFSGGHEGEGTCADNGNTAFTCSGCTWAEEGGLVWCHYVDGVTGEDKGCYQKTAEECTTTQGTAVASCPSTTSSASGGGSQPSSSSGGGTPIILSHNSAPVTGLNVVSFARSLKIASGKDATVSLFDMNGRQVLSQRVFSGTTTISLANQKQGVYYAVVKSSSHKQTVKVVLK